MKVKQLLTSEKKWTKGFYAKDKDGAAIGVQNEKACSFCLDGALSRCYGPDGTYHKIRLRADEVIRKMTRGIFSNVVFWNDYNRRTFKQVKAFVTKLNI